MTDREPDDGPRCGTAPDCDGQCCKLAEPRDVVRQARLDSLGILLTRIANGRTLTPEEARLLVEHVGAEVSESTTARTAGADLTHRAERAEAAVERVRALHRPADDWSWQTFGCGHDDRHEQLCAYCRACYPCPTLAAFAEPKEH
ncbi:hypothetical protein [Streptomyces scabiei]|uniref:hypothetical protein n=1 Tax=Streptomyces scabiei TaxID=1930 RepID=UPI0004E65F1A|nr:hypothetical protein [Streptomyces scabiei]KFG08122.1 hypothetical protein IQ61_15405 [Streptomyces scabiei]MDX3681392.1 hypothetical protein [Streptomyces scabiei]